MFKLCAALLFGWLTCLAAEASCEGGMQCEAVKTSGLIQTKLEASTAFQVARQSSADKQVCSGAWEQCGGEGWNGPTCCGEGFACICQDPEPYHARGTTPYPGWYPGTLEPIIYFCQCREFEKSKEMFIYGELNSNDCPAASQSINDEQACRAAAMSMGLSFHSVGSWWGSPGGCFQFTRTSKAFFNRGSGLSDRESRKICQAERRCCLSWHWENEGYCEYHDWSDGWCHETRANCEDSCSGVWETTPAKISTTPRTKTTSEAKPTPDASDVDSKSPDDSIPSGAKPTPDASDVDSKPLDDNSIPPGAFGYPTM